MTNERGNSTDRICAIYHGTPTHGPSNTTLTWGSHHVKGCKICLLSLFFLFCVIKRAFYEAFSTKIPKNPALGVPALPCGTGPNWTEINTYLKPLGDFYRHSNALFCRTDTRIFYFNTFSLCLHLTDQ